MARIIVCADPDDSATLAWLDRGGWCWAVEVFHDASEEQLRALRARGWEVILQLMGHPESRREHFARRGTPVPEPDEVLARHIRAAGGRQDGVIWLLLVEEDSAGVAFPQVLLREKPETRAEAFALYKTRLEEAMASAPEFPGVRRWARAGYASGLHAMAAAGAEMVLVERTNDDVEDLQTGLAFCRGAAGQYDARWGVDFSQWWGPAYCCPTELPASYFRRNLYLSYFAGAEALMVEYLGKVPPRGATFPQALDEFGRFTRRIAPGSVDTPVAVVIPRDSGWMTPPYWQPARTAWNYARLPYTRGMRGIDGFFGLAFPGSVYAMQPFPFGAYASDDPPASPFALSSIGNDFAPSPEDVYRAEPPLPFGRFESRREAEEAFHAASTDPSPYRPMADTRWGGGIDVFTDRVAIDVLSRYHVAIVLGETAGRDHLRRYVEQGGTLVWASGQAAPEDRDFSGVDMTPELHVTRAWAWGGEQPISEHLLHTPARLCPGAAMLAETPDGIPLVVRNGFGAGRVFTCLVPWFEGGHTDLAALAARLFDHVIQGVQPVSLEGLPAAWVSTTGPNEQTVCIANHGPSSWRGAIRLKKGETAWNSCTELTEGFLLPPEPRIEAEVPPWGVRVYRWSAD